MHRVLALRRWAPHVRARHRAVRARAVLAPVVRPLLAVEARARVMRVRVRLVGAGGRHLARDVQEAAHAHVEVGLEALQLRVEVGAQRGDFVLLLGALAAELLFEGAELHGLLAVLLADRNGGLDKRFELDLICISTVLKLSV